MAEMLRRLVGNLGKKENKQEERAMVKPRMERSYAEMVKGSRGREGKVVRVEVRGEEISENLRKLEHCLVGSWNPSSATGVDLERLGWLMARSWGLQGKLGLARLEKGRILLELEFMGEAKHVLSSGNRLVGGVQLGLERWSPRCGCEEEGGNRKEAWVKILGLPISLWVPSILRRVGDECGEFVAMDPQMEKMKDFQWARILIKTKNEDLSSTLDIVVEEACYSLSLWWEIRPEMRKVLTGSRSNGRSKGEVKGDVAALATPRMEELENARLKALLLPADGIGGQDSGAGGDGAKKWVQVGSGARAPLDDREVGLSSPGLSASLLGLKLKSPWNSPSVGQKLKGVANVGAGPGDGPSFSKA